MDILLDPELSSDLLCTRMPFDVDCNSVFVVDMSTLSNPKDITCDDMGVWKWNGSYRRCLCVDEKGIIMILGKTLAEIPSVPHYHIWRRYYENKSSQDLKKMMVTLEGMIRRYIFYNYYIGTYLPRFASGPPLELITTPVHII